MRVSLKRTPTFDFGPSAATAAKVAKAVLKHGLPPRSFLNINVPAGTPKGMRVTTQAKRNHVTKIDARTDPRGNAYYWIEEALDEYHPDSGRTDYEAVREGYISVTPLQPDMTAYEVLAPLVNASQVASLVAAIVAIVRRDMGAQSPRTPTARLVSASRFDLPARIDSNNPAVWSLVDGVTAARS